MSEHSILLLLLDVSFSTSNNKFACVFVSFGGDFLIFILFFAQEKSSRTYHLAIT